MHYIKAPDEVKDHKGIWLFDKLNAVFVGGTPAKVPSSMIPVCVIANGKFEDIVVPDSMAELKKIKSKKKKQQWFLVPAIHLTDHMSASFINDMEW